MTQLTMNTESLPPTLQVLHFGRLCKKSVTDTQQIPFFQSRWGCLTYGIFCYFRTCEKAKAFIESLPCSNSNTDLELTKGQHRIAFKNCLNQHPPRGYIKLLDRHGNPVSNLIIDKLHRQITITHKHRSFVISMDTQKGFNEWLSCFSALGVEIQYVNQLENNNNISNNCNNLMSGHPITDDEKNLDQISFDMIQLNFVFGKHGDMKQFK
eukprot:82777_1